MAPKVNTVVGYLLPLVAVYFFIYIPLFQRSSSPSAYDDRPPAECSAETLARLRNTTISLLPNISCPAHEYSIHLLHRDPLIIYVKNFLSSAETAHLVSLSVPHFQPSTIYDGVEQRIDTSIRDSEVALLPDHNDATVQCVAERALAFQGNPAHVYVEEFRVQRYHGPAGHYAAHYDWTGASRRADRVSTFMVYLEVSDDVVGGGTHFPRIARPKPMSAEWCEFIECGEEAKAESILAGGAGEDGDGGVEGLTFKPISGSAVYWENLRPKAAGRGGYEETWHAGLPVRQGTKIGLNVWSWLQEC